MKTQNSWISRTLITCFTVLVLSAGAKAQNQPAAVVSIPALNCKFNAMQWTLTDSGSSPYIQIEKQFDGCSPALFESMVTAKRLPSLTISGSASGDFGAADLVFSTVSIDAYHVSSGMIETISVVFKARTVTPSSTTPPTSNTVQIPALACSFTPMTWFFSGQWPVATGSGSVQPGKLSPLAITRVPDSCSRVINQAMTQMQKLANLTLIAQVNGSNAPTIKITLTGVTIASDFASHNSDGTFESLSFNYDQIALEYVPTNASGTWNVTTQRP